MDNPNPEIDYASLTCPACGARNERDSNFCDQCAKVLRTEQNDARTETSFSFLAWIFSLLFVIMATAAAVIFRPHGHLHNYFSRNRISEEDFQWISWANYIDAETISGQAISFGEPKLIGVASFEGMHALNFRDSTSHESIIVNLRDDKSPITANQMANAWNTYKMKIIAAQHGGGNIPQRPLPQVMNHKKLKLLSGEIVCEQIIMPFIKGGFADGMQAQLMKNGTSYSVTAYGSHFSEGTFLKFLNDWQAAPSTLKWSLSLSSQQKSVAFTRRGEWLKKSAIRHPEAIADFQRALQLDPNNAEARIQLQSVTIKS